MNKAEKYKLPDHIDQAIKSGHRPVMRDWRNLPVDDLTLGEKVCRFAERHLKIPEGEHAGQPLKLAEYQIAFILAVMDSPVHPRMSILSIGRRNGKTFITAVLALAALCMKGLAKQNAVIASAALGRDQAALIFRAMAQMIEASPALSAITKVIPSSKRIVSITNGSEYIALSAEAKSNLGRSIRFLILDESGQIADPASEFVSMLRTSQGSYSEPYFITISTQAPSSSAYLSLEIDRAERENDPSTVCHVYAAPEGCDLADESAWIAANPAISEGFRSVDDIREQAAKAKQIPAQQSGFMNLILNQRVSALNHWLSPTVWKDSIQPINESVFQSGVHIGLDLSQRNDLTVAVIAARDQLGRIHLDCLAFTPVEGLEERARRDANPYDAWARSGKLITIDGAVVNYRDVSLYIQNRLDELSAEALSIQFDRWRINEFKSNALETGFGAYAEWVPVGQGYRSMSVRIEAFETELLERNIISGNHPILNLGASHAIITMDGAGNRKLEKHRAANKIDGAVAMIMAVYPFVSGEAQPFDVSAMII